MTMELLVYTTSELAGAVAKGDSRHPQHQQFSQFFDGTDARVLHASEKFGTLVVEVDDMAGGRLEEFLAYNAGPDALIRHIEPLLYQVRVNLTDEFAAAARKNPADLSLKPINDVLEKYEGVLKNQFDAFADFCREQEEKGLTDNVLYRWTKALVDNPAKEKQYSTRFTVYAEGGQEVYSKKAADGLEADLKPFLGGGLITQLSKFNTDPAQNPQAGPEFR